MMNSNPALAAQFEQNPWIRTEKEKLENAKKLRVFIFYIFTYFPNIVKKRGSFLL